MAEALTLRYKHMRALLSLLNAVNNKTLLGPGCPKQNTDVARGVVDFAKQHKYGHTKSTQRCLCVSRLVKSFLKKKKKQREAKQPSLLCLFFAALL